MADNHLNEAEREVIERAIRFIESGSHTVIARETMANELRKLAARRTPVADGAAPRVTPEMLNRLRVGQEDARQIGQELEALKQQFGLGEVADGAAVDLPPLPQPAFHTQHGYVYLAEQVEQIQREAISHYLRKQVGQVGADPLLVECKRFLEDMHAMPVDWTIKESQALHAKVASAVSGQADKREEAGHGGESECSLKVLAAFLAGCAPIEGVWFGEEHPNRPGRFWWRDFLPAFRGEAGQEGEQPTINKGEN